ncbi:MAG: DUF4238 domain-containing protein [Elusimicrobiaceae bacterium]|nr:DUF4238 domain-containing protein [Elusimicrobiaceae bacterium]
MPNRNDLQLCKTKDNHYVPQFYLKSFSDTNKDIHYLDKETKKYYKTNNFKEIGKKTNLYTVKNKINSADIFIFKNLFKLNLQSETEQLLLSNLVAFLNDDFKSLLKDEAIEKELNMYLEELLNTPDVSRNQELLFSFYEDKFLPLYNNIIQMEKLPQQTTSKEDSLACAVFRTLDFITSKMVQKIYLVAKNENIPLPPVGSSSVSKDDPFDEIVFYLIIQYFRTRKRMNIELLTDSLKTCATYITKEIPSSENIIFLLIQFHSFNIFDKLINRDYKLILLVNETEIPFITSDNPAVNPYAEVCKDFGAENLPFEIFFPLTPKLGLLYTPEYLDPNFNRNDSKIQIKDKNKICYWNKLIFKEAEKFIYANSKDILYSLD